MASRKQEDRKKLWVRVICIVLVVLLMGSTLAAIFGIF